MLTTKCQAARPERPNLPQKKQIRTNMIPSISFEHRRAELLFQQNCWTRRTVGQEDEVLASRQSFHSADIAVILQWRAWHIKSQGTPRACGRMRLRVHTLSHTHESTRSHTHGGNGGGGGEERGEGLPRSTRSHAERHARTHRARTSIRMRSRTHAHAR